MQLIRKRDNRKAGALGMSRGSIYNMLYTKKIESNLGYGSPFREWDPGGGLHPWMILSRWTVARSSVLRSSCVEKKILQFIDDNRSRRPKSCAQTRGAGAEPLRGAEDQRGTKGGNKWRCWRRDTILKSHYWRYMNFTTLSGSAWQSLRDCQRSWEVRTLFPLF